VGIFPDVGGDAVGVGDTLALGDGVTLEVFLTADDAFELELATCGLV
jgi:hypothetical protein